MVLLAGFRPTLLLSLSLFMMARGLAVVPNSTTDMISSSLRAALPKLLDISLTPLKFEYDQVSQQTQVKEDATASISLRQAALAHGGDNKPSL